MDILYRDGDVVAVSKPAGMLSQPAASAGGQDVLSSVCRLCGCNAYAVHRLDACTGGAMVVALNPGAAAYLSEQIKLGEGFGKEYLAVVCGVPDPAEGSMRDLLFFDRKKGKSFVVDRMRRGVKDARLDYCTLASSDSECGTLSVVKIRLYTGRTHQIRVQFSHRHVPLFGDRRYGGCSGRNVALWSCRLTFRRPSDGQAVTVTCDPPGVFPWTLFE